MIFCFSGTGNSRYIANRIAEVLKDKLTDLNAKIKTQDNSQIQTGARRNRCYPDVCLAYLPYRI